MDFTRKAFVATLVQWMAAESGRAQTPEVAESLVWTSDSIKWQPDDPPGASYSLLDGDRDRSGSIFSYAFRLPGGVWARPHIHSQTAYVVVVRGQLKLGFGRNADRSKARIISEGQFFIVRANQIHFEGSEGECIIIGIASGGWKTTVLS